MTLTRDGSSSERMRYAASLSASKMVFGDAGRGPPQ